MTPKKISVSHLKNNMADVLNEVAYTKVPTEVYKYNNLLVTITPPSNKNYTGIPNNEKLLILREKYGASEPKFPDVTKDRNNKNLDSLYE